MSCHSNVDIMLLSCPSKVMDYPGLSLPALTGFLKHNSIKVLQRDINLEIKDIILTEKNLTQLYKAVIPFLLKLNVCSPKQYNSLKVFYKLLKDINDNYGFKRLVQIKEKCQRREYDFLEDSYSLGILEAIFQISKCCDFFFSFVYTYFTLFRSNNIAFFLIDYLEVIAEEVINMNPKVLGLSMITTQNNFTLWFASFLKYAHGFKGYILLGGSQPTKFQEQYLLDNPAIDFVIAGEGEYPLLQLIRELSGQSPQLDTIPRLIYRTDKGIIKNSNKKYLKDCYQAVLPSYEGLPLNKYLSPVLPILASSNCPWKKCRFCAHRTSFKEDYHERAAKDVVDEMEYMHKQYGTSFFHFADETINAKQGADIGRLIEERRLPIIWMSFGRLDDEFTKEYIEQWYRGGARVVEWGLESGSDKVLTSMNKGITVKKAQEIMQAAGNLGMKNKLLTWHNYPGEELEDLLKTINFVRKNVMEGFAAPMLTLKQRLVLQVGSELYDEVFIKKTQNHLFTKVWYPASLYSINASYYNSHDFSVQKLDLIESYIKEMREYCRKNKIFIATNENISFDLIIYYFTKGGGK